MPLEDKLMRRYFHDAEDKFKINYFCETVSPIVYSVTGTPDQCSGEELPGKCMVMVKDIIKKRRQYLQKKRQEKQTRQQKRSKIAAATQKMST